MGRHEAQLCPGITELGGEGPAPGRAAPGVRGSHGGCREDGFPDAEREVRPAAPCWPHLAHALWPCQEVACLFPS